ncbi:MAG: phosphatidylglycerophosphatase and protein-tyrosine phosphatase 1 family protein [Pirellulaceae bacterium]|nr:phosphatidylglycerophosphatase and protein-tyrosine phosphatase 1 family protein [Pirellulaceae bacterium]
MFEKIKATVVFVPTLIWNMLLGRWLRVRNWWDRIDETLIVGALPFEKDVESFAGEGVTCVVNTCAEYAGPVEAYKKHGIVQLRVPTVDFTHPSLESVKTAVDFIQQHTQNGGTVYVHCKAGRARSATVAMCWLIRHRGMSPEQAQTLLLEKRPHINRFVYARPVVVEFYKQEQATAQ